MDDFRNRQVFSFIDIQGLPNCLVLRRIQILAYWYSSWAQTRAGRASNATF